MKRYTISWQYEGYGDWQREYETSASSMIEAISLFLTVYPGVHHLEVYEHKVK